MVDKRGLTLTRKVGEEIVIRHLGTEIYVILTYARNSVAKIRVSAPSTVEINRGEIDKRKRDTNEVQG